MCGLLALPYHHHDPLSLLIFIVHHFLEIILGDYLYQVSVIEILRHYYRLIILFIFDLFGVDLSEFEQVLLYLKALAVEFPPRIGDLV